jgi:hypothetical protein
VDSMRSANIGGLKELGSRRWANIGRLKELGIRRSANIGGLGSGLKEVG